MLDSTKDKTAKVGLTTVFVPRVHLTIRMAAATRGHD
jgi:hypothetical protein